ncbi:MAG: tetratricopeptide repeat protein [Deltaproteobacteria bacterium]|nr:tetratricopeptide repeat protein [Deltaproteobacteria bacterium]
MKGRLAKGSALAWTIVPAIAIALSCASAARAEDTGQQGQEQRQQEQDAQQPQEFIARPDAKNRVGFFQKFGQMLRRGASRLWEKEQPDAARGNQLAAENNPTGALEAYDSAEKKLPQNSESSAELAFNRSAALLKGEATEAPKALEQAMRAQESGDQSLRAKAAYNAALALEQAGKTDEALQAYGQALRLDPDDVDSKVNLELLLQQKERTKKQPQQGAQDKDQKNQDKNKQDQQQQEQSKGEDKKDEKEQQGKEEAQKKEQEQQPKEGEDKQKGQEKEQEQAQKEKEKEEQQKQQEMGRSEAQRLLDAAKAGEKNLQAWRFGKKPEKDRRRSPVEKDW